MSDEEIKSEIALREAETQSLKVMLNGLTPADLQRRKVEEIKLLDMRNREKLALEKSRKRSVNPEEEDYNRISADQEIEDEFRAKMCAEYPYGVDIYDIEIGHLEDLLNSRRRTSK